jgi:four helix bundle protein
MEKFWNLLVFKKAHQLVLEVYKLTEKFPQEEKFGLISQIRRAVVSAVGNIVESTKRKSIKDRKNFLVIADGSLEEAKYSLFLASELKFANKEKVEPIFLLSREIGTMLNGFSKSIK